MSQRVDERRSSAWAVFPVRIACENLHKQARLWEGFRQPPIFLEEFIDMPRINLV